MKKLVALKLIGGAAFYTAFVLVFCSALVLYYYRGGIGGAFRYVGF